MPARLRRWTRRRGSTGSSPRRARSSSRRASTRACARARRSSSTGCSSRSSCSRRESRRARVFEERIEIRWRDLDAYGHVNQAVYVTYAEEVLDAWLRQRLGLKPGHVWDYVAKKTTLVYHAELRQTDLEVAGTARVARVGTTSVTVEIELRRPDGEIAAEVEAVIVAIDGKGGGA